MAVVSRGCLTAWDENVSEDEKWSHLQVQDAFAHYQMKCLGAPQLREAPQVVTKIRNIAATSTAGKLSNSICFRAGLIAACRNSFLPSIATTNRLFFLLF
jgi:hypothetical protein